MNKNKVSCVLRSYVLAISLQDNEPLVHYKLLLKLFQVYLEQLWPDKAEISGQAINITSYISSCSIFLGKLLRAESKDKFLPYCPH